MDIRIQQSSVLDVCVDGIVFPWHKAWVPVWFNSFSEPEACEIMKQVGKKNFQQELPTVLNPSKVYFSSAGYLSFRYKGMIHFSTLPLSSTLQLQLQRTTENVLGMAEMLEWKSIAIPSFHFVWGLSDVDLFASISRYCEQNRFSFLEKIVLCSSLESLSEKTPFRYELPILTC